MKIEVIQKDIDKGVRSSFYCCPIAFAFKRAVKNNTRYGFFYIGSIHIVHCLDGKWNRYELPKKAQKFIKRFDDSKPVEPFSFELKKVKAITYHASSLI
jgi:hypothetical protein